MESLPEAESRAEQLGRMSLIEHLTELRNRLLYSLAGIVVGFGVCWGFRDRIVDFIVLPIEPYLPDGKQLQVLTVTDSFFMVMKIVALASLFLVAPWLVFQAWRFVAPGLYKKERGWSLAVVILGSLLFVGGGAFAYFQALPRAIEFLVTFSDQFEVNITATSYLSFMMTVILGLGLMFQMPIFIFALAQIGVVTPRFLMRHFRWAVLIIFILAAIITPTPDPFNLCLFALPAVALYLLGVGAAWLAGTGRRKKEAATDG